jgi:hypothetical protein
VTASSFTDTVFIVLSLLISLAAEVELFTPSLQEKKAAVIQQNKKVGFIRINLYGLKE